MTEIEKKANQFVNCLSNLPIHKQWELAQTLGKGRVKKLNNLIDSINNKETK